MQLIPHITRWRPVINHLRAKWINSLFSTNDPMLSEVIAVGKRIPSWQWTQTTTSAINVPRFWTYLQEILKKSHSTIDYWLLKCILIFEKQICQNDLHSVENIVEWRIPRAHRHVYISQLYIHDMAAIKRLMLVFNGGTNVRDEHVRCIVTDFSSQR